MSVRTALPLILVAALAAPTSAAAKEIEKVQVCGASGCHTFDRANSGGKLALFDPGRGNPAPAPSAGAPWYRMKVTVRAGADSFSYTDAYVPSLDLIRRRAEGGGHEWFEVIDDLKPVLRNVSRPLQPLPAATLPRTEATASPLHTAPPPAGPGDGGSGPYWIAAPLAALVVALGLLFALRRRSRRPPAPAAP